ncbi:MAG: DUF4403 family protein [Gemmatimonadota bacterium]
MKIRSERLSSLRSSIRSLWILRALGAVLAATVVSCGFGSSVEAPAPPIEEDLVADTTPRTDTSVVDAEIRYDLEPAIASLERAVPRAFGDIETRNAVPGNPRAHFAFAASRSPFTVRVNGTTVSLESVIEFEGRGWYKPPITPEVSAACGTSGVLRPRARIRIASTLVLTPAWNLQSRSRVLAVEPYGDSIRDRCRVTLFRIDVTDKVLQATRGLLGARLRGLDSAIARVSTRERFERWWRDISRPVRLSDSVWLVINPLDVELGEVRGDRSTAIAALRLEAQPMIITGNRPNDFELFKPLPRLTRRNRVGRGLRVSLQGDLGYDVATVMLQRAIVGRQIDIGPRSLRVDDITLMGIGRGRVAVGVRFGGSARGNVYFTGTPQYDPASDQLLVPDLDYDLATSDLLVRGLSWLKDDAIRDFLRQRARFPVDDQLDRLRQLAELGMNRTLAPGVELSAQLDQAKAISVRATTRLLHVRALATGSAVLLIDKPPAAGTTAGAK